MGKKTKTQPEQIMRREILEPLQNNEGLEKSMVSNDITLSNDTSPIITRTQTRSNSPKKTGWFAKCCKKKIKEHEPSNSEDSYSTISSFPGWKVIKTKEDILRDQHQKQNKKNKENNHKETTKLRDRDESYFKENDLESAIKNHSKLQPTDSQDALGLHTYDTINIQGLGFQNITHEQNSIAPKDKARLDEEIMKRQKKEAEEDAEQLKKAMHVKEDQIDAILDKTPFDIKWKQLVVESLVFAFFNTPTNILNDGYLFIVSPMYAKTPLISTCFQDVISTLLNVDRAGNELQKPYLFSSVMILASGLNYILLSNVIKWWNSRTHPEHKYNDVTIWKMPREKFLSKFNLFSLKDFSSSSAATTEYLFKFLMTSLYTLRVSSILVPVIYYVGLSANKVCRMERALYVTLNYVGAPVSMMYGALEFMTESRLGCEILLHHKSKNQKVFYILMTCINLLSFAHILHEGLALTEYFDSNTNRMVKAGEEKGLYLYEYPFMMKCYRAMQSYLPYHAFALILAVAEMTRGFGLTDHYEDLSKQGKYIGKSLTDFFCSFLCFSNDIKEDFKLILEGLVKAVIFLSEVAFALVILGSGVLMPARVAIEAFTPNHSHHKEEEPSSKFMDTVFKLGIAVVGIASAFRAISCLRVTEDSMQIVQFLKNIKLSIYKLFESEKKVQNYECKDALLKNKDLNEVFKFVEEYLDKHHHVDVESLSQRDVLNLMKNPSVLPSLSTCAEKDIKKICDVLLHCLLMCSKSELHKELIIKEHIPETSAATGEQQIETKEQMPETSVNTGEYQFNCLGVAEYVPDQV